MTPDKNNNRNKKWPYRALTPLDNCEGLENYFEMLDFALADKNIRNIGLMGSYGSGKSTILESYLARNKEFSDKTVRISLANFRLDENGEANHPDSQKIEFSILQQLIYHSTQKELSKSRFHRLSRSKWWEKGFFKFVGFFLGVFLLLSGWHLYTESLDAQLEYLGLGLISVAIAFFSISLLKKLNIKKLSFLDNGIEFEEISSQENSLLNTHFDEIAYFFEETTYQNIIFEDLDRFDHAEIFSKLREINLILNSGKNVKPVKFIYALRGDIFPQLEERTKFFDFIIPVIPHTNSTNRHLFFDKNLREIADFHNHLSPFGFELFLVGSLFDNTRELNNFINEWGLYVSEAKSVLKTLKPNDKQSFLIRSYFFIAYKQQFSSDFAKLQLGGGFLAELIYLVNHDKEGLLELTDRYQNLQRQIGGFNSEIDDTPEDGELYRHLSNAEYDLKKYRKEFMSKSALEILDKKLIINLFNLYYPEEILKYEAQEFIEHGVISGIFSTDYYEYISYPFNAEYFGNKSYLMLWWQQVTDKKLFYTPVGDVEAALKTVAMERYGQSYEYVWNEMIASPMIFNKDVINFLRKNKARKWSDLLRYYLSSTNLKLPSGSQYIFLFFLEAYCQHWDLYVSNIRQEKKIFIKEILDHIDYNWWVFSVFLQPEVEISPLNGGAFWLALLQEVMRTSEEDTRWLVSKFVENPALIGNIPDFNVRIDEAFSSDEQEKLISIFQSCIGYKHFSFKTVGVPSQTRPNLFTHFIFDNLYFWFTHENFQALFQSKNIERTEDYSYYHFLKNSEKIQHIYPKLFSNTSMLFNFLSLAMEKEELNRRVITEHELEDLLKQNPPNVIEQRIEKILKEASPY